MKRLSTGSFAVERSTKSDYKHAGLEYQQVRFIPAEPMILIKNYTYIPKRLENNNDEKESVEFAD